MKSHEVRTLLALMLLSLSFVLNAFGQPPAQTGWSQPVQPRPITKLTGGNHVQVETASIHPEALIKPPGTNTFKRQTEPQWVVRTNTVVTGFVVDLLEPKQTWKMLNPDGPVRDVAKPTTVVALPVTAARPFNGNLTTHEADFALLRFSFGSPPKLTKPKP